MVILLLCYGGTGNFQCWPFAASSDNKFKLAVWLVLGFPVLSHVLTPRTKATEVSSVPLKPHFK